MLGRAIIIFAGAGLAASCAAIAVLTILGKNPATSHLKQFFLIGYAAVNAVLIPFGISGFIGGVSRKKTLIKAFITFQWWLVTLILIALNVSNFILASKCVGNCGGSKKASLIDACAQGGAMIFIGVILLIAGRRVYSNIKLEEEANSLLAKSSFKEIVESNEMGRLSPKSPISGNTNDNINVNNNIGYETNILRQPSKAAMMVNESLSSRPTNANMNPTQNSAVNVDLVRRPTNTNINVTQNSTLRRNQTDPNFGTPYRGLTRNKTGNIPNNVPQKELARYPTNSTERRVNVTRQQTIGNAYTPRNYDGAPQATYPIAYPMAPSQPPYPDYPAALSQPLYPDYPAAPPQPPYPMVSPQRSISTKQYIDPPQPSYITQVVIPPPPISKVNDYSNNNYDDYDDDYDDYDDYKPKPYYTRTKAPQLTKMRMNNNL